MSGRRLQMFTLFHVLTNRRKMEILTRLNLVILKVLLQVGRELNSRSDIQGNVDIMILMVQEFVTDPASSETDDQSFFLFRLTRPGICCCYEDVTKTSLWM